MDNYKPLTPIELLEIYNDAHADKMEALVAIERSAIENYLAQHPAQTLIVPPEKLVEPLRPDEPIEEQWRAARFCQGWNACRAEMLAAAAQTPPAPQDAQVGKDAERDAIIEECAKVADRTPAVAKVTKDVWRHVEAAADEIAAAIRALKSDAAIAAAKEERK